MASPRVQKDFYKILGIEKQASTDDIKKAHHKLAVKWHPDKNQNNEEAAAKFRDIQEAYEVLKDVEKREQYDNEGRSAYSPAARSNDAFSDKNFPDRYQAFFKELTRASFPKDRAALEKCWKDNYAYLQNGIKNSRQLDELAQLLVIADCPDLLNQFDSQWLAQFYNLKNLRTFLNSLPLQYWNNFLNHLGGKEWLTANIIKNGSDLRSVFVKLTGSASENLQVYSVNQKNTLLNYLGKDWLEKSLSDPESLGGFLRQLFKFKQDYKILFAHLGKEWLKQVIKKGADLGIILGKLVHYQEQPFHILTLVITPEEIKKGINPISKHLCDNFFKYLDVAWENTILTDAKELADLIDSLITHMDYEAAYDEVDFGSYEGVEFILKTLVNIERQRELIPNIETLVQFLEKLSFKERKIQTVFYLNEAHLKSILFPSHKFDEVLVAIDQFKESNIFPALLLALTRQYKAECKDRIDEPKSLFGRFFGRSRKQVIDSAALLEICILSQEPISSIKWIFSESSSSGVESGKIGKIYTRHKDSIKKSALRLGWW